MCKRNDGNANEYLRRASLVNSRALQQISGRVVHTGNPYTSTHKSRKWPKTWLAAVIAFPIFLFLAPLVLGVILGIVVCQRLIFGPPRGDSLVGNVFSHFLAAYINDTWFGRGRYNVQDFRVRDAAGRDTPVRVYGTFVSSNVVLGDRVDLEGWFDRDVFIVKRGWNHQTTSEIRIAGR